MSLTIQEKVCSKRLLKSIIFEVLISILLEVKQELDRRCEELMASKFGEKCDFDVEDALVKLEKLEIISKVIT